MKGAWLVRNCFLAFLLVACNGAADNPGTEDASLDPFSAECMPKLTSQGGKLAPVEERTALRGLDQSRMLWIPGGEFCMGNKALPDATPVHRVEVSGFWMDEHPVTNRQFALFVEATGYQTVAERALSPEDYPDVPLDLLVPGAEVFTPPNEKLSSYVPGQEWKYVPGANWRHPSGPQSTLEGRMDHPVVQLAFEDAQAYANWVGKRLPTESEWEYAARALQAPATYYWGDTLKPGNSWMANAYQGDFPFRQDAEDGFKETSPVKSFPANAFGLYDMVGNVWEWCVDYYQADSYLHSSVKNPEGSTEALASEDRERRRVQRGGSFLSKEPEGLLAGSRGHGAEKTRRNTFGFRCVSDAETPSQ